MNRKNFWLYLLPASLFVPLLILCLWIQSWDTRASDGQGPNPELLLWLLAACVLGFALALTTLYALLGTVPRSHGVKQRLGFAGYHVAMWLLLGLTFAIPSLNEAFAQRQADKSPESVAYRALDEGRIEDFKRLYVEARKTPSSREVLDDEAVSWALVNYRPDILDFMRANGVPLVVEGVGRQWEDRVMTVLRSRGHRPARETLDMLNWVLAQSAPNDVSFKGSVAFSDTELYESAYRDIDSPDTRELLNVLVAHGADIVGCTEATTRECPLIYFARRGETPIVRFLLSQGANPDSENTGGSSETALSAAIATGQADTLKVLLANGAHIRKGEYENDIIFACWHGPDADEPQRQVSRQTLHDAGIHLTQDDLSRYKLDFNDDQRPCIESFMEHPLDRSPGRAL
ncbi:ankyrin repeat domain-containing protein [Luteibacter aegosomaticola]|uniref:ankyrin repeat domain-containing protein n=1 Tax=Luteibacter aegosomaticola TaxID=2911538 RepID=UPI001FF86D33|nr:ankyrin repeat domain-containing protein [Luteibacter aegosomaticola]UPG89466.1 ankyrin repeat domain-containing protein [Luteibacter aegosomaticola]